MTSSMNELMSRGMECLTETLGVVEAERFISLVIRERFDYTKWQREYFDKMPPERSKLRHWRMAKRIRIPVQQRDYDILNRRTYIVWKTMLI